MTATPAVPAAGERFLPLDGLRGVAALGVVAFHVAVSASSAFPQLDSLYLFVDFFFVLSGFVLVPSMPRRPRRFGRDWGGFLVRRIFRLWPLSIAAVLVALGLLAWERQVMLDSGSFEVPYGSLAGQAPGQQMTVLVCAFLLLQVFSAQAIAINVPLWSLSAEWIANVLFGPLTIWRWGIGIALGVLAGYAMLAYGLTTDTAFIDASGPIRGWEAVGRAFIGFGLGLLLRLNLDRLARFRTWWLLVIALALVASFYFIEKDWHWDSYRYAMTYFAAPVFAFLILQISKFRVDAASRWGKFLAFLGVYSFGIYVFHQPLIQWVNLVIGTPSAATFRWSWPWAWFFIAEGVGVTFVAILITFLLRFIWERPMQRLGKRWSDRIEGKQSRPR